MTTVSTGPGSVTSRFVTAIDGEPTRGFRVGSPVPAPSESARFSFVASANTNARCFDRHRTAMLRAFERAFEALPRPQGGGSRVSGMSASWRPKPAKMGARHRPPFALSRALVFAERWPGIIPTRPFPIARGGLGLAACRAAHGPLPRGRSSGASALSRPRQRVFALGVPCGQLRRRSFSPQATAALRGHHPRPMGARGKRGGAGRHRGPPARGHASFHDHAHQRAVLHATAG